MNQPLATVLLVTMLLLTGCTTHEPVEANAPLPAESLAKQWGFDLKLQQRDDGIRSLHLRGDTLYVYSNRNNVTALSASAGKLLWNQDVTPDQIHLKPPIVLADKVIFPAAATLEIYDFKGKLLNSAVLNRSIRSGGIGLDKLVYIGLDYPIGGRLAAVDVTRTYSFIIWEVMTFGGMSAAPAMFQTSIFVGSEDQHVYAMNIENGKPLWPLEKYGFKTDGRIVADLKVDEAGVYAASLDSKLYCLDRGNGKLRWEFYGGRPLTDSPVLTPTLIYQAIPGVGVAAIDRNEGKFDREPKWLCRDATMYLSEDDKHVYMRGVNRNIVAVDKASGHVRFTSRRDDFVTFAQNQKDATIYAASEAGVVMSIKPVLKPGTIGTMVMAPVEQSEALASR